MQNGTVEALDGVVPWWITNDSVAYTLWRLFSPDYTLELPNGLIWSFTEAAVTVCCY